MKLCFKAYVCTGTFQALVNECRTIMSSYTICCWIKSGMFQNLTAFLWKKKLSRISCNNPQGLYDLGYNKLES